MLRAWNAPPLSRWTTDPGLDVRLEGEARDQHAVLALLLVQRQMDLLARLQEASD